MENKHSSVEDLCFEIDKRVIKLSMVFIGSENNQLILLVLKIKNDLFAPSGLENQQWHVSSGLDNLQWFTFYGLESDQLNLVLKINNDLTGIINVLSIWS